MSCIQFTLFYLFCQHVGKLRLREGKWLAYCVQWIWDFNLCLLECKSCDLEEAWRCPGLGFLDIQSSSFFLNDPHSFHFFFIFKNVKFYVAVQLINNVLASDVQQNDSFIDTYIHVSESESHSVVSDSLGPHGLNSPRNSPGQNIRVGSLSLSKGSFQPKDF